VQPEEDRHADGEQHAQRPTDERRRQQRPRPGVVAAHGNTGVDETEEEQDDLHEMIPLVFEMVRRVIVGWRCEQIEASRLVRQQRHNRQKRQCRVDAHPVERPP
jgi:hypothetical protein